MLHLAHHQICCYCLVVVESGVYECTFFVSQEVSSSPHGVVRMIRPNKVFHFLTTAAATQPIFQNAIITRLPNRVKIWWHWPQTRCSNFSQKKSVCFYCRPKEAVCKGINMYWFSGPRESFRGFSAP